jgi:hypothetical protein
MNHKLTMRHISLFTLLVAVAAALFLPGLLFGDAYAGPPDPTPGPAADIKTKLRPYQTPGVEASQSNGRTSEAAPLPSVAEQPPIGVQAQQTLYAVADACVLQGYPTQNLGTTTDMWAGYDDGLQPHGEIARALVRFDVTSLPPNQSITTATLRAYLVSSRDYPNYSRTVTAYRVISSWVESGVTWNSAPGYGSAYSSNSIVHGAWGWYDFDVTALVRAWYAGTYPNYGIMLRGPEVSGVDSSWRSFSTREGSFAPQLVIESTTANSPPTLAGLPDQTLPVNSSRDNAIDLWAYASDGESPDGSLTFTIANTPAAGAGVSIDSNRYIHIRPSSCWTGQTDVVVRVTDPGGLSATDAFSVTVTNSAPIVSGLPDQTVAANTIKDNAIDLWAYTSDAETVDSSLSFTIANTPAAGAGVSIDSNRYVDIRPSSGWTGQTDVAIRAADPCGLVGTDTFSVTVPNSAPVIAGLPDQSLMAGESKDNAIDLWAFTSDAESSDSSLSFAIANAPSPGAGVSIDSSRYVDIHPSSSWSGDTDVVIRATDPGGLSGTDTFSVHVSAQATSTHIIYLPFVMRDASPPSAPTLDPIANGDGDGNYAVSWSSVSGATGYLLQEDDNSSFSSPTTAYTGTSTSKAITGRDVGTYSYRVQATNSLGSSQWSNVVSVTVTRTGIIPVPGTWYCYPTSGLTIRFSVSSDSSSASNGFMTAACGSKSIAGPATIQNNSFTLLHSDGMNFISATFDGTRHAQGSFGFWASSSCWALGNMSCSR